LLATATYRSGSIVRIKNAMNTSIEATYPMICTSIIALAPISF